jgi:hypothetical protein
MECFSLYSYAKEVLLLHTEGRNWRQWMKTGKNYTILTAMLCIMKQMCLMFPLYAISLNESHPHLYYQTHIPSYKRTMGNKNDQNRKNTNIATVCCHTCALVTCITSHTHRILIGLPIINRGIQPLFVALHRTL